MNKSKNIRNIGIFAHVDAGKTTLTEHILYHCKSIRKIGRVDKGTAQTDQLSVERERGISVKSASASVNWKSTTINIIDTPGHVDFSAEVERALLALDGAILVISAVEGVQSQTEIIYKALRDMNIPTIIFVNKIDRLGVDLDKILKQINMLTEGSSLPLQEVMVEDYVVHNLRESESLLEQVAYELAEIYEPLANQLINDEEITLVYLDKIISQKTIETQVIPVLFGSALKGIGVIEVIDSIKKYLPSPTIQGLNTCSGVAYKINNDQIGGKVVHTRLYEGTVKVRDTIYNASKDLYEKVSGIYRVNGSQYEKSNSLEAGEIGLLCGLKETKIGDIFGKREVVKNNYKLASPTLTVKVQSVLNHEFEKLVTALHLLEEEDPLLNVNWKQQERELHVDLMGIIQMEILTKIIKERFNIDVWFEKPTVVYKETPTKKGVGKVKMYTPYFGALEIEVEPLERGKGFLYESLFTVDFIFPNFQNEVELSVPAVLREGVYGWEVTDLKVNLIGGRSVKLATKAGDFKALTPMAVMDAIKDSEPTLLEPINSFEFHFHQNDAGVVFNDLFNMRATIIKQDVVGEYYMVKGTIPVATSLDYAKDVAALSQGKSVFHSKFKGYEPCELDLGSIRKRKSVDPSDRKRYIISISNKGKRDNNYSQIS